MDEHTASRPVFGFALPQIFLDGPPDLRTVRVVAQRNRKLGFSGLWTQEQLVGTAPVLEPVSLLSYVAALVDDEPLGVSVLPLPQRSPIELAKQLATLDHLCGGRLVVGVGLGSPTLAPVISGMPLNRQVRRFVEGLEVMEQLWSDGPAHVDASLWSLTGVDMEPKPLQRPRPTLWLGGQHPNALDRAARLGDGWMGAGITTLEAFRAQVGALRTCLRTASRDTTGYTIAKRVYVCVDGNQARARAHARRWIRAYYRRDDGRSEAALCGTPAQVWEGLSAVAAAGAETIVLSPLGESVVQQEALAEVIRG